MNPIPTHAIPARPLGVAETLEPLLTRVESSLQGLGEALLRRDAASIDQQAAELHRALSLAVQGFASLPAGSEIPAPLKRRLALASAQVASQRECLARAASALDRAIDVLMPQSGGMVYSSSGAVRTAYGSSPGGVRA